MASIEKKATSDDLKASGLDPDFDGGVIGNFNRYDGTLEIVTLDSSGKLLLVGAIFRPGNLSFQLVRVLANGKLDPDFAVGGILSGGFKTGAQAFPYGAKVYNDGKILLVGTHYETGGGEYLAFARYLENGKLDETFGNGGLVLQPRTFPTKKPDLPPSRSSRAESPSTTLALGANGEILMAAQTSISKFEPGGQPDKTFNGGGSLVVDFVIAACAVASNGDITVVGTATEGGVIARYDARGVPDRSFGKGGLIAIRVDDAATAFHALALREDGSVFVTGTRDKNPSDIWGRERRGVVAGFTASGQPNLVFNGGQPVVTEFEDTANAWISIGEDRGKGIVVAGSVGMYNDDTGLVGRYTFRGEPDPEFGVNGLQKTRVGYGANEWWESVVAQPDHKVVVAGVRHNFSSTGCAARLLATNKS